MSKNTPSRTGLPPERIHDWQRTQLSIASHYGGLAHHGHGYTIAYNEPGQPLVRDDVLRAEAKAARAADKAARAQAAENQEPLL